MLVRFAAVNKFKNWRCNVIAALPLMEDSVNSGLSPRFARSPYFAIINTLNSKVEFLANTYNGQKLSAGKLVLQHLLKQIKVDTLIALELGLHVHKLAMEENLQLIILQEKHKTLHDILELMQIQTNTLSYGTLKS